MSENENKHPQNDIPESVAARRLKGLGVESTPAPEGPPAGADDFWGNFWYHHKWKTIGICILTVILVICTLQMCTKEPYDVYLLYAGPSFLSANEERSVQDAVKQIMPDYNEDGHMGVLLSNFNYLTDAQIAERLAMAEADGVEVHMDYMANATVLNQFELEVMSGESVVYLLDPALYAYVREAGGLLPLAEVLGEKPANAVDDYGIRLSDTELYDTFSVLQLFPEDTVLCIRRVSTMAIFKGKDKTERMHAYHVDLFTRMVTFEAPTE